jgi:hypothetical protein
MPWKNGGGTTTEIARFPTGSTLDDFEWRVSMARIETAGPFSRFQGIDRSLAILQGEGLALVIEGAPPVSIGRHAAPLSFAGETSISSTLAAGAVEDFNVMTRRGRYRHVSRRARVALPTSFPVVADLAIFLVVEGEAVCTCGDAVERVAGRDALVVERSGASVLVSPERETELLAVDLWRC